MYEAKPICVVALLFVFFLLFGSMQFTVRQHVSGRLKFAPFPGKDWAMPCFKPLTAFRFYGNHCDCWHTSGKLRLYFGGPKLEEMLTRFGDSHEVLILPCGKCVGCQLKRAGDWAMRCMHEFKAVKIVNGERVPKYEAGCFITLTYDHEHLPENRSLRIKDFQDFMKRLREYRSRVEDRNDQIKYFMCGEYGPAKGRPHYHAVLFGWAPKDQVPVPNNPGCVDILYDSEILTKLWKQGRVRVGTLTARSCAYVARYCMKKVYGEEAEKVYTESGRIPPYNGMSKGIGADFFFQFKGDFYPSDFIVDEETFIKRAVPRFYDKILEALDKGEYEAVKIKRAERSAKFFRAKDNTLERLSVREKCVQLRVKRLTRKLDMEG